jgi:putative membrane protein
MINRLILHIVIGIISLWIATLIVPGVKIEIIPNVSAIFGIQLTAFWQVLILIGFVLSLINFFIKPILNTITLPLRILTLGLFSLIINIIIIWILDILFLELIILGLIPLFWTAIIVWLTYFILGRIYKKK